MRMSDHGDQRAAARGSIPKWVVGGLLGGGLVVVALLVVIVVLLVGGGGDGSSKVSDSPSAAKGKTFEISGNVTLTDSGNENFGGGQCAGGGGYDDMREGAQVVVTDSVGKTLAVGALGRGTHSGQYAQVVCVFPFVIADVPSGVGPYSVEIGHRGKISFTEIDASDLELTLGD